MKTLFLFIAPLFLLLMVDSALSQTSILGKLLSVDGRAIPKTVISIEPENKRDIFDQSYNDIFPDENGAYQFNIQEPGLYRLTFKGVFHHELRVPIMIYDQPSMNMNVLLFPMHFNDGTYFDNDEYLEWIRVVGNFNDYDYNTGKQFSLNSDGSISAFIPVNSDTIRYHVRGITYNQSATVLPQADEYGYREDVGFESVLYDNLPNDSLEIRYNPDDTISYNRHFPFGVNPTEVNLNGFISFNNQENENWVRPLSLLQPFLKVFSIIEWEMAEGIPIESQIQIQEKYAGNVFEVNLSDEFEQIHSDLSKQKLHSQQRAILALSYVTILGFREHKARFLQMRRNQSIPELHPDMEIINLIPEIVPSVHPAWKYNNGAVDYLLTETDDPQKFVEYFHKVVQYNPNDRAVELTASSIIRHFGSEYSSVEEMPVYQMILHRYGENDVARTAHMAFRNQIEE